MALSFFALLSPIYKLYSTTVSMSLLAKILGKLPILIYETRYTGLVEHDIMRQHFCASANNYAIEETNLIIINEYFI